MLVLGRNLGDTIIINENITIKFMKGKGADFKVAIDAPKDVKIVRGEVDERQKEREAKFAYLESLLFLPRAWRAREPSFWYENRSNKNNMPMGGKDPPGKTRR